MKRTETEQKNVMIQLKMQYHNARYKKTGGTRCGRVDDMKAPDDWREMFAKWGYVPCVD